MPATLDIIQAACAVDQDALSLATVCAKPQAAAADSKASVTSPKKAAAEAPKKAPETPKVADSPKVTGNTPKGGDKKQQPAKKASKGKGK